MDDIEFTGGLYNLAVSDRLKYAKDVALILEAAELVKRQAAELAALRAEQSDASRDVLAERRRQVEVEGWTPEHDDKHNDNAMSVAAACYALANIAPALSVQTVNVRGLWSWTGWADSWFKPKDKRRNLIRAAALLLAEIERLDRAIDASRTGGGND